MNELIKTKCKFCGKEINHPKSIRRVYCSRSCKSKAKHGSRIKIGNHYFIVSGSKHPKSKYDRMTNGVYYIPEHVVIYEQYCNIELKETQNIFHINGNRLDNNIDNLLLYDNVDIEVVEKAASMFRLARASKQKGIELLESIGIKTTFKKDKERYIYKNNRYYNSEQLIRKFMIEKELS